MLLNLRECPSRERAASAINGCQTARIIEYSSKCFCAADAVGGRNKGAAARYARILVRAIAHSDGASVLGLRLTVSIERRDTNLRAFDYHDPGQIRSVAHAAASHFPASLIARTARSRPLGAWILSRRVDQSDNDILLVENFR